MHRIAVAVLLSGLVAGCGQPSPAAGTTGSPAAELDFIEAVPIPRDAPAPVAQPQPVAKKDEAETETKAAKAEPATAAVASQPSPEPEVDQAAAATRKANETTATPYLSAASETPARPD